MSNNQRTGAPNNAYVGKEFEEIAKKVIENQLDTILKSDYSLDVGFSDKKNRHKFDLGNKDIIVECKSHRWTSGNNVPSAKLTVWNEAMLYFYLAGKEYRKIFFFEKSEREKNKKIETLGEYYIRNKNNLIPDGVEFWEYDIEKKEVKVLNTNSVID